MTIRFNCPSCNRQISAKEENAGKKGRCACGITLTIPSNNIESQVPISAEIVENTKQPSGQTSPIYIDKDKFGLYQKCLDVKLDESPLFFTASTTPVSHKSGLAGFLPPVLHLYVSDKRLSTFAIDKNGKTYIESIDLKQIRYVNIIKCFLGTAFEVDFSVQDGSEKKIKIVLGSDCESGILEKLAKKIEETIGGFTKSSNSKDTNDNQKNDDIIKPTSGFHLDYLGGHPDRIDIYRLSGCLNLFDDKLQYISGFRKEVLFSIQFSDIDRVEQFNEGEIRKQYSVGKAITGTLLLGGAGTVGGFLLGKEKDERKFFLKICCKYKNQPIDVIFRGCKDIFQDAQTSIQKAVNAINGAIVQFRIKNQPVAEHSANSTVEQVKCESSISSTIRELAQLKTDGLITEEEYQIKKKQILGL